MLEAHVPQIGIPRKQATTKSDTYELAMKCLITFPSTSLRYLRA
jgi:hypothetical protein